jgi:hypothetical protein
VGTNFYWKEKPDAVDGMDPAYHIGKRSAAGAWCWDCGVTLCEGGIDGIHMSRCGSHKTCPKCGAVPIVEDLDSGAVAVELGFANPRTWKPTGVRSCSSFTWAQDAAAVRARCEENVHEKVVVDEYGREMTGQEFLTMLTANCPVQFYSIGEWFS